MGKYSRMLEMIQERFGRYQTYFQVLDLDPDYITDEIAKEAYDKKCRELDLLLKDCNEEEEEIKQIREIIQTALNDAYSAVKDENSREHYKELLDSIERDGDAR